MRIPLLIALLLVVSARSAAAEPVVLAVDGADLYLDVGATDGVGAGSELELLHEIVARDPLTGATLRDRFALGTVTVIKSGDHLSVARAEDDLARRVLPGDQLRLLSAPRQFDDPWAAQVEASRRAAGKPPTVTAAPAPTSSPKASVDHVALAAAAWQETLGKAAEPRIQRWMELLAADPRSPYREAIEEEIVSLTGQAAQRTAALAKARSQRSDDRAPRIAQLAAELAKSAKGPLLAVAPLPRAAPGQPIELSFLVRSPAEVEQAWLFVRPAGDPGFRRLELRRDGDAYLRATVEGALVRAPELAWYVEVKRPGAAAAQPEAGAAQPEAAAAQPEAAAEAATEAVIGSQQQPMVTSIDEIVDEPPIATGRSHIDAHVDYVDFDGKLADGFDQYYQGEIDFTYRFLDPVYAVRLGFGTLSGTGGPKDVIDADPSNRCLDAQGVYQCRKVTFSYVYTEVELRLRPSVAILLRPQAGLLTTDAEMGSSNNRCQDSVELEGCGFHTRFGGRARLRFGSETGNNLAIGAGFTSGVGTLLEAAYQWLPSPVVPVQLVVQVTDMPVPENLGVRLIGDVGWRKLAWVYPSLRLSYQARDIDHAGFSGGLAMNFDW